MAEMRQDRIAFDVAAATSRRKDEDGHLHVTQSNLSKATVNGYYGREIPGSERMGLDPNRIYKLLRDPKELEKGAASFNGKPLLVLHKPQTAEDHDQELTVGSVNNVGYNHPFMQGDVSVWHGPAIAGIENNQQRQLSASYRYDPDMTPGTFEGEAYDGVMRNIRGNHMCLVENGRAGSDVLVGDSAPVQSWGDRFAPSWDNRFSNQRKFAG
jgi:hypothetical protein